MPIPCFAGFLLLFSVFASARDQPHGFRLDIATSAKEGVPCGDHDRQLLAFLMPGDKVLLNAEVVESRHIANRLRDIFGRKTERVIFVVPEPDVTVGQVVTFIDVAREHVDRVALLSHEVLRNPGNCGPLLPVPSPPKMPNPAVKFVPWWQW
jgi:hypothetical protein